MSNVKAGQTGGHRQRLSARGSSFRSVSPNTSARGRDWGGGSQRERWSQNGPRRTVVGAAAPPVRSPSACPRGLGKGGTTTRGARGRRGASRRTMADSPVGGAGRWRDPAKQAPPPDRRPVSAASASARNMQAAALANTSGPRSAGPHASLSLLGITRSRKDLGAKSRTRPSLGTSGPALADGGRPCPRFASPDLLIITP